MLYIHIGIIYWIYEYSLPHLTTETIKRTSYAIFVANVLYYTLKFVRNNNQSFAKTDKELLKNARPYFEAGRRQNTSSDGQNALFLTWVRKLNIEHRASSCNVLTEWNLPVF